MTPTIGQVEQRSAHEAAPTITGNRLCGLIPYNVESSDLGGWRERIAPGALANTSTVALVATLNHDPSRLLGRYPTTLELEDRAEGMAWSVELPNGPTGQDVREAVRRGDLNATSWRMVVGRERWDGATRIVEAIDELRDVSVVTNPAYPNGAPAELRARDHQHDDEHAEAPTMDEDTTTIDAPHTATPAPEPGPSTPTPSPPGGATTSTSLRVEDRSADTTTSTIEARVVEAMASVRRGEVRSLTTTSADAITPPELSTYLWDRIRPVSVALASGIRVVDTDRGEVTWPALTGDMTPGWTAEGAVITATDPTFSTLTATPRKLAARVEVTNEVWDDSEPEALDVLTTHIGRILALKLDVGLFEGSGSAPEIRGLKNVAGTQTVSMGTNGATPADLDFFADAVAALEAESIPGPYVAVMSPRTWATLRKLREQPTGSNKPLLAEPPSLDAPRSLYGVAVYVSAQLSITETQGTASNTSSVYVYAPREVVLVRRQDATVEADRSRLFDKDMSEVRGKLRADLLVPHPKAVVRVVGVKP